MSKLQAQTKQFGQALLRLKEAIELPKSDIVRDSAIKRFEFTMDLAWKSLKSFLEEKKGIVCASPKECFREAYRQKILGYEAKWLELVDMRNETVHSYNLEVAEKIYNQLPDCLDHFDLLLKALV